MRKTVADIDRFMSKVLPEPNSGCWLWGGTYMPNGYGVFRAGSVTDGSRRNVTAHRFVCETVYGLPSDKQALHKCDVKACVNPDHLYVGTHKENMQDAKARKRMRPVSKPGELNPNARLKESDVREILVSEEATAALAAQFGVTKTHISYIRNGKAWGHVSGY